MFYSANVQYSYNFYGTDLYANVCRGTVTTKLNIFNEVSPKSIIADVLLSFKYASRINFTAKAGY